MVSAGSVPEPGTLLVLTPTAGSAEGLVAGLGERGRAVGVVTSAPEAMRRVATERCDGIIVSGNLTDPPPAECIGALRVLSPALPLVFLTDGGDATGIVASLQAGADGFIRAEDASADVVDALLARLADARRVPREQALREAPAAYAANDLGETVRRTAHEMNQPLTVIFGLVDVLLLDAPDDSEVRTDLLTLQREAERLRVLARGLVQMGHKARAGSGRSLD